MIEVEATFNRQGEPRPRQILWQGQRLKVADLGGRWSDDLGQHMLTRVIDGRVFELVYNGGRWSGKVVSQPPQFT